MVQNQQVKANQSSLRGMDGYNRTVSQRVSLKIANSIKYSFTYLCLDELTPPSTSAGQTSSGYDCFAEATQLIRKLLPPEAALYHTGSGESVLIMEEDDQHSAIPVALKLINVVRARFQLSNSAGARVGLSAGILILSPNPSRLKLNTTLIIETARQLCREARELGNNALQVYDMNSHQASASPL